MADTLYRITRLAGIFFHYKVNGLENVDRPDPAIFVSNHLNSVGPISIVLSIPVRFHPWVIAEMVDFKRAPQYLYNDFILPTLHLNGKVGMLASQFISRVAVVLLRGLGSLAVDRNRGWVSQVFHQSLDLLCAGKNLLIFPEDPYLPINPSTMLRPFMGGFTWLVQMYARASGRALPIYPMAVYPPCKRIAIGKSIDIAFRGDRRQDMARFTGQIEGEVAELYQGLSLIS
jgi:hypothetical protein